MYRKLLICTLAALALTACGKKEEPKALNAVTPLPATAASQKDDGGKWEPYNCGKGTFCLVQVNPQDHSAILKADVTELVRKDKPELASQLDAYKIEMKTLLKFDCNRKMGRLASVSEMKVSRTNPNDTQAIIPETQAKTEDWVKMSPDRDDWAIFNKACRW